MEVTLSVEPHPLLDLHAFVAVMPSPLGELARPPWFDDLIAGRDDALTWPFDPFDDDDSLQRAVRALLRHGGFSPSGRNKPASEYLARAAADGRFPSINLAVDLGNAVSLHARLPVSVVDLERLTPPLHVAIAPAETRYPFNPSGQVFDAGGLVGLSDRDGVAATAVKDAQRSKTSAATTTTLQLIWGVTAHAARGAQAAAAHRSLLARAGAVVAEAVTARPGTSRPA